MYIKGKQLEYLLGSHLKSMSSDYFAGRKIGTVGAARTRDWLKEQMRLIGLSPLAALGGFEQRFEVLKISNAGSPSVTIMTSGGRASELSDAPSAVICNYSKTPTWICNSIPLVFAGYGVVCSDFGWNDYCELDVEGKGVVVLPGEPKNGGSVSYCGRWVHKCNEAAKRGAGAVFLIHDEAAAGYSLDTVRTSLAGEVFSLSHPSSHDLMPQLVVWIDKALALEVFPSLAPALAGNLGDAPPVKGVISDVTMSVDLTSDLHAVYGSNVVARLEGNERPDEHLLFMAHWDHLGVKIDDLGRPQIFNGAVDNASGVAMLLTLAEILARGEPLSRSVLFVLTDGEEYGFLGARAFVQQQPVPLHNIIAGVNIDTYLPLGRTKDVKIVGWGTTDLDIVISSILAGQERSVTEDAARTSGNYFRGDHICFAQRGVPIIQVVPGDDLLSGGRDAGLALKREFVRTRYHTPADKFDSSWDLAGLLEDLDVLASFTRVLGNSSFKPVIVDRAPLGECEAGTSTRFSMRPS
ncbi:M28 family peptidase [Agrobacterium sp. 22-226-1]